MSHQWGGKNKMLVDRRRGNTIYTYIEPSVSRRRPLSEATKQKIKEAQARIRARQRPDAKDDGEENDDDD